MGVLSVLFVLLSLLLLVYCLKAAVPSSYYPASKMPFGINIRKKSSPHQASKQSKKQDEIDREKNSYETQRLKALVAEKDKQISELKQNADLCKKSAEKAEAEKLKLSSRLTAITTELEQAQKINERFVANHTDMEQKISKLKRQLDVHSQNEDVVSRLELDYRDVCNSRDRLQEELQKKNIDISKHDAEIDEVQQSLVTSQKKTAALEKTISELRSERNQREARVLELEKELSDYECKWKESEVEITRNRQNLSDFKQKCASLTDENAYTADEKEKSDSEKVLKEKNMLPYRKLQLMWLDSYSEKNAKKKQLPPLKQTALN